MKNLDKVISEYLKLKTNYAVLITGKWGSGKTFYYKNTLVDLIKETETISDASKYFRPIHISLFGLKSIEDIQSQIFLTLYPLLKNKALKLSFGVGKSIARGAMALANLGNIDDYISDVKPDSKDIVNFEDLVICFDDFERKSPDLPLDELIGFINSMVENNEAKIILIADEDRFDEKYSNLKEKVIGVTVEYLPDLEKNIKEIIINKYSAAFSSYASFLTDHINLLINFSESYKDNFRILIYVLDRLHIIYSEIKTKILDVDGNKNSIINLKLETIIRFTIGVSIEYKKHSITYVNREDLNAQSIRFANFDFPKLKSGASNEKIEINDTFKEKFIKKYFNHETDYRFFESIYSYVTGASTFDIHSFTLEVEKLYHIKDDKIEPQYVILEKLNYLNYFKLEEKQYRTLTSQMVGHAEKGNYKMEEYLTIFHFATRFDNILNYKPKTLKERLIKGLKKGKTKFEYQNSLEMYFDIPENSNFKTELVEIKKKALEINNLIRTENKEKEALIQLKRMTNDWDLFKNSVQNKDGKWAYTPFFHQKSSYKMFLLLNNYPSSKLWEFAELIRVRYGSRPPTDLKEEIPFLESLSAKLEPKSKTRKTKTIRNHLLNLILKQINVALIGFKEI